MTFRPITFLRVFLMCALILSVASCSLLSYGPLRSGEVRLIALQMPDVVQEGIPYDAVIRYSADERPDFKRACFRWAVEEISSGSPSLYCYAVADPTGMPSASDCDQKVDAWRGQGSQVFCVGPENMRAGAPGTLIVGIRPEGLKPLYNKLECYVEYEINGRPMRTNKAGAAFMHED